MDPSALTALSPVDGRYAVAAAPLRDYLSEAALIRERIRIEALWFEQLAAPELKLLGARAKVLLPELARLVAVLRTLARQHAELPMLARTHGQSASPTTFGKEMANVGARVQRALQRLEAVQ